MLYTKAWESFRLRAESSIINDYIFLPPWPSQQSSLQRIQQFLVDTTKRTVTHDKNMISRPCLPLQLLNNCIDITE
jgi:hypothetical protein